MNNRIIVIIIGLILVAALGFGGYTYYNNKKVSTKRSAVFMTDGHVYFGYLKKADESTVVLNDVYYLKTQDLRNNTNTKILLVKMGNELHGPEGNMSISREQILFWQTLKNSSKINDAISRFNQTGATPTPSPSSS